MSTPLHRSRLLGAVQDQLRAFFPWYAAPSALAALADEALERTVACVRQVAGHYGPRPGEFDPDHTDQYATFLYFLANTASRAGERETASRAYALNKALHAIDVFHEVELPDVFLLVHPVGTVLGRATYGNHLVVYHGCTVGANLDLEHPTLGDGVALMAGSAVLGRSTVGDNTLIGAGAVLLDAEVPRDSVVEAAGGPASWRPTRRNVVQRYFGGQPG